MRALGIRVLGISYDTGLFDHGHISHDPFDPRAVARDLEVIRDELHCTAVRLTGSSPDRLETAAKIAAGLGLEVWFCPFTSDLSQDELRSTLFDLAERAERLRHDTEVVLVAGAELSLLTRGFLPGDTIADRIDGILQGRSSVADVPAKINAFLAEAVAGIRERFSGKVTYASIPFEGVDWTPFDFVGVDSYRTKEVADIYPGAIRNLVAQGKPVAITEFGCATYRGAADLGARAGMIIEYDGHAPVRLNGEYEWDEQEQAACVLEMLDIFDEAQVDAAFLFTFAGFNLRGELDLASYGVVEVHEDGTWTPKAAFRALNARQHISRISMRSGQDWH